MNHGRSCAGQVENLPAPLPRSPAKVIPPSEAIPTTANSATNHTANRVREFCFGRIRRTAHARKARSNPSGRELMTWAIAALRRSLEAQQGRIEQQKKMTGDKVRSFRLAPVQHLAQTSQFLRLNALIFRMFKTRSSCDLKKRPTRCRISERVASCCLTMGA